jgi:hypothetical protein
LSTQETPEELLRNGEPEFEDDAALIKEMRSIFDWMAQERGAKAISSRKFKQRLPELHRRMPQVASSFRRMDVNGDGWLEWSEFANFCLKDARLQHQMQKTTTINVYAKERGGLVAHKDMLCPDRQCEIGTVPPLLPWEMSHVIEWRIENVIISPVRGAPVKSKGDQVVRPGMSLASPPFRGAGVCGFLRFWPAGYWTEAQKRMKEMVSAPHFKSDKSICGPYPMPPPDAWCCLGCVLPAGTHLVLRFFAGDQKSEKREVFWHEGNFPGMLWSPEHLERPVLREGDSITVGVEIFRNVSATNSIQPKKHKQQGVKKQTPFIRDETEACHFFQTPEEKLKTSTSLPALPTGSTWRNLDALLQAYRRDEREKANSAQGTRCKTG